MRYRIPTRRFVLAGCAAAVMASTGCRGGMSSPGWDVFGWGKKPSASAIAGNGPSSTYPLPPSQSGTPNAVASVAGDQQGADRDAASGDFDVNTGYAANSGTATPNDFAAATANGYGTGNNGGTARNPGTPAENDTTTPGYGYAQAATAGGYQYGGGKTATQPAGYGQAATGYGQASDSSMPSTDGYGQAPASYASAAGGSSAAGNNQASGFQMPPTQNRSGTPATSGAAPAGGGYGLPSNFAGNPTANPPSPPAASSGPDEEPSPPASGPAAQTATLPPSYGAPSQPASSGSYLPGSTQSGTAYPGGYDRSNGNLVR